MRAVVWLSVLCGGLAPLEAQVPVDSAALRHSVEQLRSAIGRWSVTTEFLNPDGASPQSPEDEVRSAEAAFAASMAARDFVAFQEHVAEDAVFFGPDGAQRGRAAVLAAWRPFFDGAAAPFSWAPESVTVLPSGALALSSGPVFDPTGKRTATFNSIWRRDPDGRWRVVFDKGTAVCECASGRPSP